MMKRQFFTVLALLGATTVSAGCQIMSESEPKGDPDGPAISTSGVEPVVEQTASCAPGVLTRLVGQPASALEVVDLQENTRIIHPGTPITEDHRPERVNIDINDAGIITRVWCG